MMHFRSIVVPVTFLCVLIISCSKPGAVPINYGNDNCEHCKMTISDQKYAAELVSTTGKAYKFDSPECMADFIISKPIDEKDIALSLVTNLVKPGEFIDAKSALYYKSSMLRSPMGMNYSAFESQKDLDATKVNFVGVQKSWSDAIAYVKNEWAEPGETGKGGCTCSGEKTGSCSCSHEKGESKVCDCKEETKCACKHGKGEACICSSNGKEKCDCKESSCTCKNTSDSDCTCKAQGKESCDCKH